MLTIHQNRILALLWDEDHLHPGQLADRLELPFAQVLAMLCRLVGDGLVGATGHGFRLTTSGHRLVSNDREAVL